MKPNKGPANGASQAPATGGGSSPALIGLVIFISIAAGAAGYFFYKIHYAKANRQIPQKVIPAPRAPRPQETALIPVNIYYPKDGSIQMEQRMTPLKEASSAGAGNLVVAALNEFFRGPLEATKPFVPSMVEVLGVYKGEDGVLYVNLSDEMRRNFEGDAAYEFMLLRGLYETVMSASPEAKDVKVLVEGRELDTLGGHISLLHPLGESLSDSLADALGEADEKVK